MSAAKAEAIRRAAQIHTEVKHVREHCPECGLNPNAVRCTFCGRDAHEGSGLVTLIVIALVIIGVWHIIDATGPFWRAFASTMGAGW